MQSHPANPRLIQSATSVSPCDIFAARRAVFPGVANPRPTKPLPEVATALSLTASLPTAYLQDRHARIIGTGLAISFR
jgi:hypothetical protein